MNGSKAKVVEFSRRRTNYDSYNFVFREENIATASEYKYLGIAFNYKCRFRKAQHDVKKRAARAVYSLPERYKHDLLIDLQLELFNVIVMAIMTHACGVTLRH